jgi:hypothetical protein
LIVLLVRTIDPGFVFWQIEPQAAIPQSFLLDITLHTNRNAWGFSKGRSKREGKGRLEKIQ